MSKPFMKVSDFTKAFFDGVRALKDQETLVGIPVAETNRNNGESGSDINNATILFINEFGSPANNIPPRTPMATGIRMAQKDIADEYKKAAQAALKKGAGPVDKYFERVGIIASNSVKKVINNQIDMEPPAERTLAQREAQGFKGTKALVVTGQMRNAITYVVRNKSWGR